MKKILPLVFFAALFVGCTDNNEQDARQALIARMQTLSHKGLMYGHQDDPFYGLTWMWEEGRSDTYELVGDYPAVLGFDLGGLEEGHDKDLDSVPFEWIRREAIGHVERGGIITFSWHPRNPRTGGNAWDTSDSTVVRNILPGGEQHDKFIGWMDSVATFLSTLRHADGTPVPFIFRPWHEYNGSWFWWGQKLCSDEEFLSLFYMFEDYMNERLPNQIVWSQSPNLQGNWNADEFERRFVGADRCDILGLDCYQWGSEDDFIADATSDAEFLSTYAHTHCMLFAVTECGRVNSDIPDWWSRVFLPCIEGTEACYCLPWRNWHREHFGASKETSTADDFRALCERKQMLLLTDIQ